MPEGAGWGAGAGLGTVGSKGDPAGTAALIPLAVGGGVTTEADAGGGGENFQ